MMMTVERAKTKWCPKAIVGEPGDHDRYAAVNRGEDYTTRSACRCIATECMWWRWNLHDGRVLFPVMSHVPGEPEPAIRPPRVPADWVWKAGGEEHVSGWMEPLETFQARRTGFCGAAGKPEAL